MRINCPHCGSRDRREFYYQGAAIAMERPTRDASHEAWNAYVHLRDNPAGETREMWFHEGGCGAWLVVTRNTVSHQISAVALASDVKAAGL